MWRESRRTAFSNRWAAAYGSRLPLRLAGTTDGSHPFHRHRDLRAVLDGLIDHAIAFGEFQQQVELVLRRIGTDLEAQANLGKADRRFLVDAERAAEVEITLGDDIAGFERHVDGGRDRF